MEQLKPKTSRFSGLEMIMLLLCFFICLTGALLLPVDQCPDESGRLLLTEWIVKTGTLPTGNEPEVIVPGWGFSYALRPYLFAIVGAFFKRISVFFTDSPRILLAASRMCSVLSVSFCCFFCLRLGHRLFEKRGAAVLFAVFVCFLPQVMFLGMYQNNDALSLCAVSVMLYYLAEGYDSKWSIKCCVGLAFGFSVGLLSYYSIYGWILGCVVFCLVSVMFDNRIPDKGSLILKRAALIFGLCLFLAGWFFIRNAIMHNGDIFGFSSELRSREHFRSQGYVLYDYVIYRNEGMSAIQFLQFRDREWIRITAESFVGVFGYMIYYLPMAQYGIYGVVIGLGILLCLAVLFHRKPSRRDGLLFLTMLLSTGINIALHFWHSYVRDYQPQGRYIISAAILLGFMIAYGMDKTTLSVQKQDGEDVVLNPAAAFTLVWLLLFAWACIGTMTRMIH